MIQNYNTIKYQVDLLEKKCGKEEKIFCQNIYSTAHFICFKFRKTGENIFLYLGKGKSHSGLWIHESIPDSMLRIQDKFLGILRKDIRNSFFMKAEIDEKDRIVYLTFRRKGEERTYGFFWKGQSFYFAKIEYDSKKNQHLLFSPGESGIKKVDDSSLEVLKEEFDLLGRKELEDKKDFKLPTPIEELLEKEEQILLAKSGKNKSKKMKSIEKRIEKIKSDQNISEALEFIEKTLLDTNDILNKDKINIGRYKLKFDKNENIHHRHNKVFELRKKINRSMSKIQERLDISLQELENLKKSDNHKIKNIYFNNTPVWKVTNAKRSRSQVAIAKEKSKDSENLYREYKLQSGKKCLVGSSARGNDAIRKENKNKDHLWFHLDARESAHLIVEACSISELENEELQVIASILKSNSQLSSNEIDMMYSPLKDLKAVKGKAGLVRVSRPKYLRMNYLENWKDFLAIS